MPRPIALLLVATLAAGCAAQPAARAPMNEHGSTVEHGPQEGPNQAVGVAAVALGVIALGAILTASLGPM